MANACAFCGDDSRGLTDQHVWPNWLRKYLLAQGVIGSNSTIRQVTSTGGVRTWNTHALDVRVKAVCQICNNGWMSAVENMTKPALTDMVLGKPHRLTPTIQRALATWAVMAAAMIQRTNPTESVIPPAHYDELYVFREPPTDIVTWVFALPRLFRQRIADVRVSAFVIDEPGFKGMHVTTFSIGVLAFQVVGVTERATSIDVLADEWRQGGLERIWPVSGRFTWPPRPLPAPGVQDPLGAVHNRFGVE